MLIRYGDGWLKFPDVVWERSWSDHRTWVSRPVTKDDIKRRKSLGEEQALIIDGTEVIT